MSTPVYHVALLVHPFYSFWDELEYDLPHYRKAFKFLSGLWSKRIREVAMDPHAVLILVRDATVTNFLKKQRRTNRNSPHRVNQRKARKWFMDKIQRFEQHAEEQLGERFFLVSGSIEKKSDALYRTFRKRGFHIMESSELDSRPLTTQAFGEWWHRYELCVTDQAAYLKRAFRINRTSISKLPELSIEINRLNGYYRQYRDKKKQTMGPLVPAMKKQATMRRRGIVGRPFVRR